MSLLPLEILLRDQLAAQPDAVPTRGVDYWSRYTALLDALRVSVYPHINAGLACLSKSPGIFTDHGPEHFDEVVRYAGQLLGVETCGEHPLKPYELYLLLCAIRLHDAGNIDGRDEHEKRVDQILYSYGGAIAKDTAEATLISRIAEAHGGYTFSGDKDTIGDLPLDDQPIGAITCRPRQVAAIVRFADEICEHAYRASRHHIDHLTLPEDNKLFHYYASSITGAHYDFRTHCFRLHLQIKTKFLTDKYPTPPNAKGERVERYLIDEALDRISKLECERRYCNQFLDPRMQANEIEVNISLLGEQQKGIHIIPHEVRNYQFRIPLRQGYPGAQDEWRSRQSELVGSVLVQRIKEGWQ
jgi:hypothetical protein